MPANGADFFPELVETPVFTRLVADLWTAEEYRRLQVFLVRRPDVGHVIPGSGGLRKCRWGLEHRGKRGSCRVVYAWLPTRQRLYLLLAYRKQDQDDLTPDQLRVLRQLMHDP